MLQRLEFDALGCDHSNTKRALVTGPGLLESRMTRADNACRPNSAGFTLIEMTLVLALISLIAALALPRVSFSGSETSLRIKGFEIAAILRADRDEAVRSGLPVTSVVDLVSGRVLSSTANGVVAIPANLLLRISGAGLDGIRFMPDGRASGGEIFLMRADGSGILSVRVDPHTAAIVIDRSARHDE